MPCSLFRNHKMREGHLIREISPQNQRVFNSVRPSTFILVVTLCALSVGQENFYPHNAVACDRCHNLPREFGSSSMTVQRVGYLSREAFTPVAEGGIRHRFGESATSANPKTQTAGGRVSLSLLGDGFIEAIGDKEIAENADQQRRRNDGIFGMVASAPVLEANGRPLVLRTGRFGWKNQHSSLMSSCADSLRNELGVRNRLYPDEYPTHAPGESPTPFDTSNPRTRKTELDRLVDEIRHTAPPLRDQNLARTEAAQAGEKLFDGIGCAICHVPTYKTLPPGTLINGGTYKIPKLLGNKIIHPYSDFVLHDVGTGDGIPQAAKPEYLDQSTANKFRTPPLWALRFRANHLMHDGDTPSPEQAIKRHGGEATKVRDRYELLSSEQKQQLLTFLSSL